MSLSLFGLCEYEYIDYKDLVKLRSFAAAYRRKIREMGRNGGTEEGLERTRCAYFRQLEKMYQGVFALDVITDDVIDIGYMADNTAKESDGKTVEIFNGSIIEPHQMEVDKFDTGTLVAIDIPFKVRGVVDFNATSHNDSYTGYISVMMINDTCSVNHYVDAYHSYRRGSESTIGSYLKHIHEVDCLNIFDIPDIFTFVGEDEYEKITALCDPLYAYFMINDFIIKYEDIGK